MVDKAEVGFSAYVKRVRPDLRRHAFLLCRDWHEADDLVQQTLTKLYLRWRSLGHRHNLHAYTRRVMLRVFISNHRAVRWSRELVSDQLPEHRVETDHHGRVDDRLLLLTALARIPPRQRAVILLRYWENLTPEEAATILRCSPSTVRSQTCRALTSLREYMQIGS